VFVSRSVRVVIDVTDDDSECVRAADWLVAAVPDDNGNVVLFTLFAVERLQAGDDTGPVSIVTTTYNTAHDIGKM